MSHLPDAAEVGGWLWDHWLPGHVRRLIGDWAGGDESAKSCVRWLAGMHDIGKMTPAFFAPKLLIPTDQLQAAGLTWRSPEHTPHALAGQVLLDRWLVDNYGANPGTVRGLTLAVGGHHGRPPTETRYREAVDSRAAFGDRAWADARTEALEAITDWLGVRTLLPRWVETPPPPTVQVLLSALVIVCDWLASDPARFPYEPPTDGRPVGLDTLDFLPPWSPLLPADPTAAYGSRFDLPGPPNEMQRLVLEFASSATAAPMIIIESPTGSGKTEATLAAAERLAERFGLGGVYLGLPTMATSNAMFPRVTRWERRWQGQGRVETTLAHGKAHFNQAYTDLGRPKWIYDSEDSSAGASPVANRWFRGSKRALLANVVVGTVDQLLLSATQAKHVVLRHLGLYGKVVIVDEVHAADVVMRHYLCRALEWLGAAGTPVILLTATLPPHQKRELLAAYQAGRDPGSEAPSVAPTYDYPLVTRWDGALTVAAAQPDPRFDRVVEVARLDRELPDLLLDRLHQGGIAAVIRNTVRSAQETYAELVEVFGDDVVLLHSRLLTIDRLEREDALVSALGRDGDRPRRLVVVATQVVEQSIDLDFDLMVTDLAPADLVVQRLGRLHRHADVNRPLGVASPMLVLDKSPRVGEKPDRGSSRVYGTAALLRAAIVLAPHLDGQPLDLPRQVPQLVRSAYDPGLQAPEPWAELLADADAQAELHRVKSISSTNPVGGPYERAILMGWLDGPDDNEQAQLARVRDGADGLSVIVLERTGDGLRPLPHLSRRPVLSELETPDPETSRYLAQCSVGLPAWLTLGDRMDAVLDELERDGIMAWQESHWLAGELLLVLPPGGKRLLAGYELSYDRTLGLLIGNNR